MNATESGYALELEARKLAGEIRWYAFEPFKLRLADRTTYTPDFILWMQDGSMQAHEVKGFWRDDARVKFKVAREMFRMFRFFAVTKHKGKYEVRG